MSGIRSELAVCPHTPRASYLVSLQVFRGIAAMWIVLFHVGVVSTERLGYRYFPPLIGAGSHAVSFFFVLSGFVIMHIHRVHLGDPSNVRPYLAKRFSRIYPLVFIIVSIKVLYAAMGGAGNVKELTPEIAIRSFLLLPGPVYLVDVLWTLVFEILFYALFAFAIALGRRVALAGTLVWVAFILWRRIAGSSMAHETFMQLAGHPYCLQFLMGTLCAVIGMNPRWNLRLGWLGVPGLALMAICIWYLEDKPTIFALDAGTFGLISILSWGLASALIILSAVSLELRNKLPWPPWLRTPGDASYSIYLVHTSIMVPLAMLLAKCGLSPAKSPVILFSAMGLGSLAGSLIFWRWVEVPVMRWWRKHIQPVLKGGTNLREVQPARKTPP